MNNRRYYLSEDKRTSRITITVDTPSGDSMPFSVFRDVGRLAGASRNVGVDSGSRIVFEFLSDNLRSVEVAEKILLGALYEKGIINDPRGDSAS